MADERLVLTAEHSRRGKPDTIEVIVAGRQPISADEDPALHDKVYRNLAWIDIEGLDLSKLVRYLPGGLIVERGQSGHRELQVATEERWRDGQLVRAVARDPRPFAQRKLRYALVNP